MGFLDLFRPKLQIAIGDCTQRTLSQTDKFPVTLSGNRADGQRVPLCKLHRLGNDFSIAPIDTPEPELFLDAAPLTRETSLEINRSYGIALGKHLLLLRITRKPDSIGEGFSEGVWDTALPDSPDERRALARDTSLDPARLAALPPESLLFPSAEPACFPLKAVLRSLTGPRSAIPPSPAPPQAASHAETAASPASPKDPSTQQDCPYCWIPFSPGDALNIATHESLTGDPVLGQHAKLRFPAERFNADGQALDSAGSTSTDLACPHCRGRLPPSFFSQKQKIISLVGAPSSGKSYYLSVLLHQLPIELLRYHDAHLIDGDPSGNAQLNEMKNRLFSATTPEDAFISKTDFEGVMYDRLHKDGKLVPLPRPFIYHLSRPQHPEPRLSLVFYDNAGEHFKPGIALEDSPGALHVAASAALLFLYDPATHPAFRKRLRRKRDPQLRSQATDEQDTLIAELGVRIRKLRALEGHQKIDTPLAILVGKLDLWHSLLPDDALHTETDAPLTPEQIAQNSIAVRRLLLELNPTFVANAESLSTQVTYFPLSSLGHSPREIAEGPLAGRLAPTPKRLAPLLTTPPLLWALDSAAASPEAPTPPAP